MTQKRAGTRQKSVVDRAKEMVPMKCGFETIWLRI